MKTQLSVLALVLLLAPLSHAGAVTAPIQEPSVIVVEPIPAIAPVLDPVQPIPIYTPAAPIGDEPGETEPADNHTLRDKILNLGKKAGNHALILFTTKHTDTVIDALKEILTKKGVPNDPAALAKFISQNKIDKDAFFKDVDTAKNYLAETQVALYTSWEAYLRQSFIKANHEYVRAATAWKNFEPAAKKVNDEIDRWQPLNTQLGPDILALGGKVGNHALILFTTKHTDTVIDALKEILTKKGVPNDPAALEKFIQYNQIDKDKFFADVTKAKNFLASAQVAVYNAWSAYLENNMIKAQSEYDKAKADWDWFELIAGGINGEIDRWKPVPAPNGEGQSEAPKLGEIKQIEIKAEAIPAIPAVDINAVSDTVFSPSFSPSPENQPKTEKAKTSVAPVKNRTANLKVKSTNTVKPAAQSLKAEALKTQRAPKVDQQLSKSFAGRITALFRNFFKQ